MVMAFALLFAQCRKPEVKFPTPSAADEGTTVSMTVTAGPGSKTDITTAGGITWSAGDRLYVGYNNTYVGYLTLVSGQNTPTGTFSGDVTLTGITEGAEQTFHFFYLGSVDYTGSLTKGESATVDVSFASQEIYAEDGKLKSASKHHVGYGTAKGTVKDGVVTGINVTMVSKVALARFSFKKKSADYTEALTLSGDNIYSDMTVNFGGTFEGKTKGSIGLTGSHAERYVMLVPTGASAEQTLTFAGSAESGTGKVPGLESNKFYGRESAIEVTVTPKFSVGENTTVEFSSGNLYYNGADADHKMNANLPSGWNFYSNQWDCYPSGTSSATESMEISLFTWGYGEWSTDYSTTGYQRGSGVTMVDWGGLAIGGYEANTWRTLTKDQWSYLLGTASPSRANASSLRAWKELGSGIKGLVILPDGTDASVMSSISSTEALATYGAVFLPAAGYRYGTDVLVAGSYGNYWSGTPYEGVEDYAYSVYFSSGYVDVSNGTRDCGYSVRLVR